MQRQAIFRRGTLVAALLLLAPMLLGAQASFGDLSSRERALQQSINSDNGQIGTYQGRLHDLQARLASIESSLEVQRALLARVQSELAAARTRLGQLRDRLAQGRRVLAAQLVSQYESPSPDLVDVVLESRGFNACSSESARCDGSHDRTRPSSSR
jgi:septal ring factor EnvC (AmiA/AmiB activator)